MHRILILAALLTACAGIPPPKPSTLQQGEQIAATYCASCHAIGRSGESAAPEAPPFRDLSRNYRVDALEEALAEGISVGHPAMPMFEFAPDDVAALVDYLQSIQAQAGDPPQ